jgi:hypothetical protein
MSHFFGEGKVVREEFKKRGIRDGCAGFFVETM